MLLKDRLSPAFAAIGRLVEHTNDTCNATPPLMSPYALHAIHGLMSPLEGILSAAYPTPALPCLP